MKDTNKKPVEETTMSQGFAAAQANPEQPKREEKTKETFSFRTMGGMTRQAMGRNPASEVLNKLQKAMEATYEEAADQTFDVKLFPIDMNSTSVLNVSVLVIAVVDKTMPSVGVAYHTLIIEGSIDNPTPRNEFINGKNVEILRTVGDANDTTLRGFVAEQIKRHYPGIAPLYADACVVPRDFNVADSHQLYNLCANVLIACSTEIQITDKTFSDLNLVNAANDSNLTVHTTFGNPQIQNAVGQPIRSDVQIKFSAAPPQQGNNNQSVDRVSSISSVGGFMDLIWYPADNSQNSFYTQQQTNYHRYAARFVVTSLESSNIITIPSQLLALITATSLDENGRWVQAFNRHGFSGRDIHDIGAIGMEVNFENDPSGVGKPIDTSTSSFRPEHLYRLVNSTFRQGMVLSLDVPECGPDSYYNGVFAAAASGSQSAARAIIAAANKLTNGAFGKHFPTGSVIAIDEGNRIHTGYFTDENGVRKDLREIDYLAIMNLIGSKDPEVVKDWSDTFSRTDHSIEVRLAARKNIITALYSDVVFTGFATRVTFHPDFRSALIAGALEAGLVLRSIDSYNDVTNFDRATSQFAADVLGSGAASGMFNRGGFNSGYQGRGNVNSNFSDRWGR